MFTQNQKVTGKEGLEEFATALVTKVDLENKVIHGTITDHEFDESQVGSDVIWSFEDCQLADEQLDMYQNPTVMGKPSVEDFETVHVDYSAQETQDALILGIL